MKNKWKKGERVFIPLREKHSSYDIAGTIMKLESHMVPNPRIATVEYKVTNSQQIFEWIGPVTFLRKSMFDRR